MHMYSFRKQVLVERSCKWYRSGFSSLFCDMRPPRPHNVPQTSPARSLVRHRVHLNPPGSFQFSCSFKHATDSRVHRLCPVVGCDSDWRAARIPRRRKPSCWFAPVDRTRRMRRASALGRLLQHLLGRNQPAECRNHPHAIAARRVSQVSGLLARQNVITSFAERMRRIAPLHILHSAGSSPAKSLLLEQKLNLDGGALGILKNLTDNFLPQPELAFQCGTAMSAAFSFMAQLYETLQLDVQSLRATQAASIFAS